MECRASSGSSLYRSGNDKLPGAQVEFSEALRDKRRQVTVSASHHRGRGELNVYQRPGLSSEMLKKLGGIQWVGTPSRGKMHHRGMC